MFGVPKDIAQKMAIKNNHVLEKFFIHFCKPRFGHVHEKKRKMTKQRETIAIFCVLKNN